MAMARVAVGNPAFANDHTFYVGISRWVLKY